MKTIYRHPDNYSKIQIERIKCGDGFDFGKLHITDETGKTITIEVGQVGLIEIGVKLTGSGLEMLEAK
mgnify:CR=1 FL=1